MIGLTLVENKPALCWAILKSVEIRLAVKGALHASGFGKYLVTHPLQMYDFTLQNNNSYLISISNRKYIARRHYVARYSLFCNSVCFCVVVVRLFMFTVKQLICFVKVLPITYCVNLPQNKVHYFPLLKHLYVSTSS